ncbi:MAG: hypothetical protein JWN37_657 [Candidatus Nomurabacteria bacterium]|nr:hypothetical protein [Candidatus Nomurabacteria bacterium]
MNLYLHFLAIAYAAYNVFRADHMGFNWIRGKYQTLDEKKVRFYHISTYVALFLVIATGINLFWPIHEYLLTRPQFYTKMAFVLLLLINSVAIGKFSKVATIKPWSSLTNKEKLPLIITGGLSTIGWLGAFAGGFFLIPN